MIANLDFSGETMLTVVCIVTTPIGGSWSVRALPDICSCHVHDNHTLLGKWTESMVCVTNFPLPGHGLLSILL